MGSKEGNSWKKPKKHKFQKERQETLSGVTGYNLVSTYNNFDFLKVVREIDFDLVMHFTCPTYFFRHQSNKAFRVQSHKKHW